ncbi:MAG: helix-turn-helix domain-containing protein [Oscillospiraceae bacterium]|nr:helix-turn-helix domain-containing protein [Oscillospiraceae bacterium]
MSSSDYSPVTDISIISIQGTYNRTTSDVVFFLILNGALDFRCGESTVSAKTQDVVMFPSREHFSVLASGSNLVLVVSLRSDFFAQGQSELLGRFVCNSVEDRERDYGPLRKLLAQLSLCKLENSDINGIHLRELSFSLLYYLNRYHYVPFSHSDDEEEGSQKYAKRYAQIVSYIEQNYSEPISLEDLAREVYLSPTYLSRFFRKHMGENFRAYLNRVRLEHAYYDVLQSDLTLTAVSYNNGFPNLNTFNQLFQAQYGMPPSQYRQQHAAADREADLSPAAQTQHYMLAEQTLIEMAAQSDDSATAICFPVKEHHRIDDVNSFTPVTPIWNRIINLGAAINLNSHTLQTHIAMFQKEIGFHYGRIESVLNDQFLPSLPNGGYNYSAFDQLIDMLLSNGLTPFLDLTNRSNYLVLKNQTFVYPTAAKISRVEAERLFLDKVSHLLRHCLNTFGISEVERWGFEIGYHHGEYLVLTETPYAFVQRFVKGHRMIKSLLPNALSGIRHNVSISSDVFRKILTDLDRAKCSPDFIALCAFPYERAENSGDPNRYIYSSDPDFIRNRVLEIKEILAGYPSITQSIYLTVLGVDVMVRNPMNDSCFQASFLVKNTLDLIGLVDAIGYWQLSDSGTEYNDSTWILFGGSGIISKHGLKKPGFTALKRLNRMNVNIIEKGDGYIVTTNGRNSYQVLMCNYIHFSDVFCVSDPSAITPEDAYSFFSSTSTKDLSIQLNNLPHGRYKIITTTLNRDYGSLLDQWLRYGIIDDLQMRDIYYFRDVVHPNRTARYAQCDNGTLELHAQLLPHEIKFLELLREY